MPEFGSSRRPPKAPLSHISEERSSQMHGSSIGNDSRNNQIRRSMSNTDTYSSTGTRHTSNEGRNSHSFEDRRASGEKKVKGGVGYLEPYVNKDDEGSQTDNLHALPTQDDMTSRRRSIGVTNFNAKNQDPETPRSNRSMCTMEQLSARSDSDEIDADEYSTFRMMEYLDRQLIASPPKGKAPHAPKINIEGAAAKFWVDPRSSTSTPEKEG